MSASTNQRQVSGPKSARETLRLVNILRLVYAVQAIVWGLIFFSNTNPATRRAAVACILFSVLCLVLVQVCLLAVPRFATPLALLVATVYMMLSYGGKLRFLQKPYRIDELLSVISGVLAKDDKPPA